MNGPIEKQAVLVVDDTPANIQVLMETLKNEFTILTFRIYDAGHEHFHRVHGRIS
jgi:CheY-like chemotaxis protein